VGIGGFDNNFQLQLTDEGGHCQDALRNIQGACCAGSRVPAGVFFNSVPLGKSVIVSRQFSASD
jgi:hypothetical protein